jgi:hypothetical protein
MPRDQTGRKMGITERLRWELANMSYSGTAAARSPISPPTALEKTIVSLNAIWRAKNDSVDAAAETLFPCSASSRTRSSTSFVVST